MNYEQKYKEALKAIESLYNTVKYLSSSDALLTFQTLEKAFPELKESEDERIRKVQLDYWRSVGGKDWYGVPVQETIAWLEKQGEQKLAESISQLTIQGKGIYKICPYCKERMVRDDSKVYTSMPPQYEYNCPKCGTMEFDTVIYDNPEMEEQNPTDEVKPKFKVGDWVVYNRDDYSREIIQVHDIRDGRYYFTDNIHFSWLVKECDEKCHLWTIQDAKDGDVLAEHETIVLFKKIEGQNIRCYCTYHYLGFNPTFYVGTLQNKNSYCPATKEQHDLLFQKMKEAGYELDAEKKELKNIEQNSAWSESEEDENFYNWCLAGIQTRYNDGFLTKSEYKQTKLWLQSLKDRVLPQPKQEWSEEDEKIMKRVDSLLYSLCQIHGSEYEELHNWLKSLKPNHWKPSEEQMRNLS